MLNTLSKLRLVEEIIYIKRIRMKQSLYLPLRNQLAIFDYLGIRGYG